MRPQSPAFSYLLGNDSNYQEEVKTLKRSIGNIPYQSRVVASIRGRTQRLLIDLPENSIGIIDSMSPFNLERSQNYTGRL